MSDRMFDVAMPDDDQLELEHAVLIYSGRNGSAFATFHNIDVHEGKATLLPGKAMTPQRGIALAKSLTRSVVMGGFLPENVLYMDGDVIVWWMPAKERHIAFKTQEELIGERAGVAPHPGLVFAASSNGWWVWAVKSRSRPTPGTALYRAPYMNVYDNGVICAGSVKLPGSTAVEKITGWNEAFFGSFFTHTNGAKMAKVEGGLYRLWRDLLDGQYHQFPNGVLVSAGMSLGDFITGNGARNRAAQRRGHGRAHRPA